MTIKYEDDGSVPERKAIPEYADGIAFYLSHWKAKPSLHCFYFDLSLYSEKQSAGTFNKKTFMLTSSESNGSPRCSAFHFSAMPPSTAVIGQ